MSLAASFGKNLIPVGKNAVTAVKFSQITNPAHRKVAQKAVKGLKNLSELLSKSTDTYVINAAKKELPELWAMTAKFEKYGLSQGEVKTLIKDADFVGAMEIFADDTFVKALSKRQKLIGDGVLSSVTKENKDVYIRFLKDKKITDEQIHNVAELITKENEPILRQLLADTSFDSKFLADIPSTHFRKDNIEVVRALAKRPDVSHQEILYILGSTNKSNTDVALKLLERAGENPQSLSSILRKVYSCDEMNDSIRGLIELRKKFVMDMLENPNFRLGASEMENFNISGVVSSVRRDNYEVAQKALLRCDDELNLFLPDFLKQVKPENKEIAGKIIDIAPKGTRLPDLSIYNKEIRIQNAGKYLQEVAKINNHEAQKYYIEAMGDLHYYHIDEILDLVRTSNPEKAKYTSLLISRIGETGCSAAELKPFIDAVEQSGRNMANFGMRNLCELQDGMDVKGKEFVTKILQAKSIPDIEVNRMVEGYMSLLKKFEDYSANESIIRANRLFSKKLPEAEINKIMEPYIAELKENTSKAIDDLPKVMEDLFANEGIEAGRVSDVISKLTPDNFSVVKRYASNPMLAKMDIRLVNEGNIKKAEALIDANIPAYYHEKILKYLSGNEAVYQKQMETVRHLAKNDEFGKIWSAVSEINEFTIQYVDDLIAANVPASTWKSVIREASSGKEEIVSKLLKDKGLKPEWLEQLLRDKEMLGIYNSNPELAKDIMQLKISSILSDGSTSIPDIMGQRAMQNMVKDIEIANSKYGIKPYVEHDMYLHAGENARANDLFYTLTTDNNIIYKIDKETGHLVSVSDGARAINIAKGTITEDLVQAEAKLEYPIETPYNVRSIKKGKKGEYVTQYTESAIRGQYDIFRYNPEGAVIRAGGAQVTPNGAKHVRRTLGSLDGTLSYMAYREGKEGETFLHSVITDKTGKQLAEVKRTFNVLSDNHFRSTYNGRAYDILFTDEKVLVTKLDSLGQKTKETVEFAIKDIKKTTSDKILDELAPMEVDDYDPDRFRAVFAKYGISPRTIDRKCVDMLKKLPGDEWFAMDKSCEYVLQTAWQEMQNNACYAGNSIFLSKDLNGNLGVFAHELGHAKFYALGLDKDEELLRIYNAEKRAFTSSRPESRINSIDYFLEGNQNDLRGFNESCAESNLMSTTIQSWDVIQDRTIFFEQDFPRFKAAIINRFDKLI